jgi:type VII secretion-associated serine protease mycosin
MLRRAGAVGVTAVLACVLAGFPESGADAQGIGQEVRGLDMTQLDQIGVPAAWQQSQGSGVTVGVLDTGVDGTVPDLAGVVTQGPDYTTGADPAGYQPPHLHATCMASIIAGHGDGPSDSEGMIGVAPEAKILSVRVILDDSEPGLSRFENDSRWENSVSEGIDYAVNHGVKVINMSLGGDPVPSERTAIAYAISRGVVVVASAGNSGTSGGGYTAYDYPAAFTGVISVAAVNSSGARASFSDKNASVVVAAPGVNQVCAVPGQYYLVYGTSPAAAFVSGVVALIRSKYPRLSPSLVEQALVTSTTERPAGGYNTNVGFGVVNASAALTAAAKLADTRPQTGVATTTKFGTSALGAIQVTHRNEAKIRDYAAVAGVSALCCLAALLLMIAWLVRSARARRPDPVGSADAGSDTGSGTVGTGDTTVDTGLQQAAQPEQVLHAGLDLHLARQPHPGDVHRGLGQRDNVLAGRGDPDVGGRVLGSLLTDIRITLGSQDSAESNAQVGNGAAHRPVAEVVGPFGRTEFGEPAGEFLQCLAALLGGDCHGASFRGGRYRSRGQ